MSARYLTTILVMLSLLMASDAWAAEPSAQVVVIDLAHAQVGRTDDKEGDTYVIKPTSRLVVDARKFDFAKSMYPNTKPNTIQLVVKDRQYSATWHPSGVTELSLATLQPLNNTPVFSGLKRGDSALLAIGEQRTDPVKKEIILKALWVGMVTVK